MLGRELTLWQTPFRALHDMQREMNEVFARLFGEREPSGAPWGPLSLGYTPQIESRVEGDKLYVRADLPGIDPKDVEVTVEGSQLSLRGERKAAHEGAEGTYNHREVRYGSFARSFTIPEGVKAEEVQATYRNGVLELCVPLPASVLPKKVPIAIEGQSNGQKQIGTTK